MNDRIIDKVSVRIGSQMYGRFEDLPNTVPHVLAEFDYITLNVPPVAFSNVPLQTWSHSVRQS